MLADKLMSPNVLAKAGFTQLQLASVQLSNGIFLFAEKTASAQPDNTGSLLARSYRAKF